MMMKGIGNSRGFAASPYCLKHSAPMTF